MKRLLIATTALTLLAAPFGAAFAQNWNNNNNHNNDRRPGNAMMQNHNNYNNHNWRKGGRIDRNDWNRGQRVNDWQHRHLQRPPRGYEWRRVDNNYVLAAAATGLIAGIILANQ